MKPNLNDKGFSFVEVMVAAGILGGLSLVGSSLYVNNIKGLISAETKMEELEIRGQITAILADKSACTNTFSGVNIGSNISTIKSSAGSTIYQTGKTYGQGAVKIESMMTSDAGQSFTDGTKLINLNLTLSKQKNVPGNNKKHTIPLRVKTASSGGSISYCFSDSEQIVISACQAAGGVWSGGSCSFDSLYVKKVGDTMTGTLTAPLFLGNVNGATALFSDSLTAAQAVAANSFTSPLFCTDANCKAIGDLALSNQVCPGGFVTSGVKPDGTQNCKSLQCPPDFFFAGLDGSSNPVCRPFPTNTCPANKYVADVNADGTVVCRSLPNEGISTCPTGQELQSINAGIPTCVDIKKTACETSGGVWDGSSCFLGGLYVKKSGHLMTGSLTAPQFNGNVYGLSGTFVISVVAPVSTMSVKATSPLFCTGFNCKAIGDFALANQGCPGGYAAYGTDANGNTTCRSLQCAGGQYFAGLDSGGNPICRPNPINTCPTNQYVKSVSSDGTVSCANLPNNAVSTCPSGQVLQSINAGVPTCVDKAQGTTCSVGQVVLAVAANGTVTCGNPPAAVTGGSCSPGSVVISVSTSGGIVCASNPPSTISGGSCPYGQYAVGLQTNGNPICGGISCP